MGTEIYTTATTVNRRSLLPIRLLLIGCSGHRCGCFNKYNCASCWRVLLGTSWALLSLVRLLRKLGCAHATTSVGAATKRRVAKDTALHVQYLLKSIRLTRTNPTTNDPGQQQPFSFYTGAPPKSVIPVVQSPRGSPRSLDTG